MRPEEYYIDKDRRIRLDKVLLGFEIDPENDSITQEELKVRLKRQKIEDELIKPEDSFYSPRLDSEEAEKKRDFLMQFIKIEEKDALIDSKRKLTKDNMRELNRLAGNIGKNRKMIDQIFNDPAKVDLQLDKNTAMAIQMNQILETQGQPGDLKSSKKLLSKSQSTIEEESKPKLLRRMTLSLVTQTVIQLNMPEFERNYDFLHKHLGCLKFFVKFPSDLKQKLFNLAEVKTYKKGEIIYK